MMELVTFLTIPAASFVLCALLLLIALLVFPRIGLLDFPNRYGLSRSPIPYPTGMVVIVTFVIFFSVLETPSSENIALITGIMLLGVVCFIDDRISLSPSLRIAVQILTALVLVMGGIRISAVTNPVPGVWSDAGSLTLDAGLAFVLSIIFTVLWLLFTINSLNWFDGIAGQVSTISTIAFLTIGFLSMSNRVNQQSLALLSFILAGISFAMFCFDFPPPKALMGDTGAMFFGLMVGVLTIHSGGKVATAFLVLGVPLIDLLFVIVRRLRLGQSPWMGNATDQHLHHRLLRNGWSPRQVIFLTAGIGTVFGGTALFLGTWEKAAAGALLFIVMIGLSWYSGKKDQL